MLKLYYLTAILLIQQTLANEFEYDLSGSRFKHNLPKFLQPHLDVEFNEIFPDLVKFNLSGKLNASETDAFKSMEQIVTENGF